MICSVIVPVYNQRPDWFRQCITSLASQRVDKEIIVTDDGSDKRLSCQYKKFCDTHDTVQYHYYDNNVGAAGNINRAREFVTGDVVLVIGSDDVMIPGMLHYYTTVMTERPDIVLLYAPANVINEDGNVIGLYRARDFTDILQVNPVPHPTAMILSTVLDRLDWYNYEYISSPDYELWTRLFLYINDNKEGRTCRILMPTVLIRNHPGQNTNRYATGLQNDFFQKARSTLLAEARDRGLVHET